MSESPQAARPYSEQYRVAGTQWVEKDDVARLLEESKSAVLAQMKVNLGDIPDSHAEKKVKGSAEWFEYIKKMVKARTAANMLKVEMDYIKMKSQEASNKDANARHELRLMRN